MIRGAVLASLALLSATALQAQTPAPGDSAYGQYPAPSACVAAAQRTMSEVVWNRITDTLPIDPSLRIDGAAQAAARRCLQRVLPGGMSVTAVPERDVAALFHLGRGLADDSVARAAWHRALKMQRIRDDSTSIIWLLNGSYAGGRPSDLVLSDRMASWLDTLGYVGERPLLPNDSFWVSQHDDPDGLAHILVDTTAMRTALKGKLKNLAALPANARKGSEFAAIGAQSEALLLTLMVNPQNDSAIAALKAKALEQLGPNQEEQGYGGAMLLLGEHYGPIHPDFWFGKPEADSIFPRPGRITLIQVVTPRICTCESIASSLHRLKARFGDSLDILLMTQTDGHFDGRIKLTPKEEAGLIAQRVREEWKVDGVLAVFTTTFVPNPDPDRRLVDQVIPELRHMRFGNDAMVVDRRGKLVLAGGVSASPYQERTLTKLIESLLRAPAN